MRIVIIIGLVIVFITTFFSLFIGNSVLRGALSCTDDPENPDKVKCQLEKYNIETVFSFFTVLSFLLADVGAVYLMIISWKA